MALTPKISSCIDCCDQEITITDLTGAYSALDNTGGWGSPNPTAAGVTSSSISITDPSGNVTTHTATDLPLGSVTITASDIVTGATTLEDGQYYITWSILDAASDPYTAYSNPFGMCAVENCVTDKVAAMDPDCDCGCDDCSNSVLKYITTFEALKGAISCGKSERAAKLLTDLQDMCNNNCKDC